VTTNRPITYRPIVNARSLKFIPTCSPYRNKTIQVERRAALAAISHFASATNGDVERTEFIRCIGSLRHANLYRCMDIIKGKSRKNLSLWVL
jgi:hypothetical protein